MGSGAAPAGALPDVVAPGRRRRRPRVERRARRLGQQVGPGARHDLDQLVAAAAGEQPAAAGRLVGEPVDGGVRGALPVDGQLQVGERVEPVGVAAVLADQDLGRERAQQRRDDRVERPQPAGVAGPAGQRDVDG